MFRNPLWPFTTALALPRVSLQSTPIVQRHVNALSLDTRTTQPAAGAQTPAGAQSLAGAQTPGGTQAQRQRGAQQSDAQVVSPWLQITQDLRGRFALTISDADPRT